MARRRTTSETKQTTGKGIESQEETLATPSSWWEARRTIERPRPEDQEERYREEQQRYAQERQRAEYYKPIQEGWKSMQEMAGAEEQKDIFRVWADSYAVISRMMEDSFTNLYKPWIESTGEMYNRAAELSRNATPENYRAFYDEWVRTYQNTFGKLFPVMTRRFDRETIDKLTKSADESRDLFQSWAAMLNENSRKTQELLQGAPDPEKYRELYNTWIRAYGKIFDDFVEMPSKGSTAEVLGTYMGVPNIYIKNFAQMAKLWRDAYSYLYRPWIESMLSLSRKMTELRGEARPEAYREFYNMWMDTYRQIFGRLFDIQSARSASKDMAENLMRTTDVYMDMYKSWMDYMEKISQRTMDISKSTARHEAYKEYYNTWVSMYERAFDDFFRYVPAAGPLKSMMEPVKNTAKIYTDTFANITGMWMRPVFGSATA